MYHCVTYLELWGGIFARKQLVVAGVVALLFSVIQVFVAGRERARLAR